MSTDTSSPPHPHILTSLCDPWLYYGTLFLAAQVGFWVRVAWLWQNTLPDTTGALQEIDRNAYGAYLREQLRQAGM